jgi:hypothetical protein
MISYKLLVVGFFGDEVRLKKGFSGQLLLNSLFDLFN